jgi:membrane protein required for colicin V production
MVTITFFDILVLFGLLGGAALGFYRGVLRQAASTLILYIAIVVASLSYPSVSRTLGRLTGQMAQATDVLAFFLLLVLVMVMLFLALRDVMRNVNVDRLGIWHNILGMVFGVLNAAIVSGVVLIVLRSVTSGEPWPAYSGVQNGLRGMITRSWMAYMFRPFTQLILNLIQPWLFGGRLPPLLRTTL